MAKMPDLMKRLNVRLAILTLPSDEAQGITDILVESGIQGIWNFTAATLDVPEYVATHNEDMIPGFAVLSVKMAQKNVTP